MPEKNLIYLGTDPKIPSNYKKVPRKFALNTGTTEISLQGGQIVIILAKNMNVLGTTIQIKPDHPYMNSAGCILLPYFSALFKWGLFTTEPRGWKFRISTVSDAHLVTLDFYSTWVEGMPPNH